MTVIYADVVFLINTVIDYLVILITGRLAGIPLQRKRFFAAALLGGFYAVAAAVPDLNTLNSIPAKLLVWLFMSLLAYGYSDRFIKEVILSGIVSCMLAGVVLALGTLFRHSLSIFFLPKLCRWILMGGFFVCFLCSRLFRSYAKGRMNGTLFPVSLSIAGREVMFTALLDTGNQLRDSVTGQPMLVVSPRVLKPVLSKEWGRLLSSDFWESPADIPEWMIASIPELCPKLIPYRTLGVPHGTLLTLQTDWIKIQNTIYPRASVAIAPQDLGLGYSALWGGTWKGANSKHDFSEKTPSMAAETAEQ